MTKANALEPGEVVAGKYRIVRTVGAGAMGAVLAADHLHLGRPVAIKVMTSDASEVALGRFAREAQAVAQIESEHVCKVFDVGTLDDGRPYMVMELLEGEDLSELAKRGHRFAVDEVVHYLLEACDALAEAHVRGIVHRDLKPSNLFLARRSDGSARVKLLDFGISKCLDSGESHGLTQTDTIVGSPRFMSPEQLQSSRKADARSDVWSLGVVAHELLTGEAAFEGGTLAELFVRILQEDPKPLRDKRPDVPPGFARALAQCFEKDRDDRYQNIAELALALAPYGKPEGKAYVERIVRLFEATGWTKATKEAPPLATVVMTGHSSEMVSSPEPSAKEMPAEPTHVASTAAPVVTAPIHHGESTAGVSRPTPTSSSGSPWRLIAAAVGGAAMVGGVVAVTLGSPTKTTPSVEAQAAAASVAPEPTEVKAPEAAGAEISHEATSTPPPDAGVEPPAAPKAAPDAWPPRPTSVAPKPSPPPSEKPAAKPTYCSGDSAFARDAQGNLKVKPECL